MRLTPFVALRHDPAVAGPPAETSAPSWSEVDPFAYAAHRTANPYTVLELLTDGGRTGFDGARDTLSRWRRTGVLVPDPDPALWVYEIASATARTRGIVGVADTADVDDGQLLEHEDTVAAVTARRVARLRAVPVDLTPVTAVHLGAPPMVQESVARATGVDPVVVLQDEAGLTHRLWRLGDPVEVARVVEGLAGVPAVLADGHHRLAAARRARQLEHGPGWGGTLAMVMDATHDGPSLRSVHRLLRCAHPDPVGQLDQLAGVHVRAWTGEVDALAAAVDGAASPQMGVVTAQGAWMVEVDHARLGSVLDAAGVPPVLHALDVTVALELLFPVMGTYHDRPVADVAVGLDRLHQVWADGEEPCDALVLLRPPTVPQVVAVAQAGERMPPKSTWFWPKPRAGLLMRDITAG